MPTPDEVAKTIEDAGGTVESGAALPDGSGFMTASFPLPKDHWLYVSTNEYGGCGAPPMPLRTGAGTPLRDLLNYAVREAARYAVRASTRCGKDEDFDPDALVQNMVVGLLGYHTPDALSAEEWDNPTPLPPPFPWSAAPAAKGGTIPVGWKLVPEEPTQAMWAAYRNADGGNTLFHEAYRAMIAASPPPPAGAAGGGSGDLGALSAGATPKTIYHASAENLPPYHYQAESNQACSMAFPTGGPKASAPTPDLGAQGEPVAMEDVAFYAWRCREGEGSRQRWASAIRHKELYPGGYDDRSVTAAYEAATDILALLQAPRPGETGDGWEPIETAPRDGTIILIWKDGWGEPSPAYWGLAARAYSEVATKRHPWTFLDETNGLNGFEDGADGPSYWRPLPPAPSQPHPAAQAGDGGGR